MTSTKKYRISLTTDEQRELKLNRKKQLRRRQKRLDGQGEARLIAMVSNARNYVPVDREIARNYRPLRQEVDHPGRRIGDHCCILGCKEQRWRTGRCREWR